MEKRTKVCGLAPLSGIRGEGERSLAEKRPSPVLKGGALAAVALGLMLMKAVPAAASLTARAATRRKQKMWPLVKMQLFPIQVVSGCHPQGIL